MPRVNMAAFIEAKRADGTIVELPDDGEITIPPAILWSDAAMAHLRAAEHEAFMRLVLGDDQYDRFVAAGGSWLLFDGLIGEARGASVGESDASSS